MQLTRDKGRQSSQSESSSSQYRDTGWHLAGILSFLFLGICLLCSPRATLSAQVSDFSLCNGNEQAGDLCVLPLADAHPTQFSVGMITVQCNRVKLEKKSSQKLRKFLRKKKNRIPAVISPDKKFFITDGHHLCVALSQARTNEWFGRDQDITLQIIRNDSEENLSLEVFWKKMEETQNVFPYDERGTYIADFGHRFATMTIDQLQDDPYRTLSTWVREGCGFIKRTEKACVDLNATSVPGSTLAFIEQYWAMYFQSVFNGQNLSTIEQLWQFYPEALHAALDREKTAAFFSSIGLNPDEYGQNQTGNHMKLQLRKGGCVKRE